MCAILVCLSSLYTIHLCVALSHPIHLKGIPVASRGSLAALAVCFFMAASSRAGADCSVKDSLIIHY